MSSAVTKIPKPQLRRLLESDIKKNLFVAITLSLISGYAAKVFIKDARKQKYADFYKTYNAEEDFERMRKLGLFQSC